MGDDVERKAKAIFGAGLSLHIESYDFRYDDYWDILSKLWEDGFQAAIELSTVEALEKWKPDVSA